MNTWRHVWNVSLELIFQPQIFNSECSCFMWRMWNMWTFAVHHLTDLCAWAHVLEGRWPYTTVTTSCRMNSVGGEFIASSLCRRGDTTFRWQCDTVSEKPCIVFNLFLSGKRIFFLVQWPCKSMVTVVTSRMYRKNPLKLYKLELLGHEAWMYLLTTHEHFSSIFKQCASSIKTWKKQWCRTLYFCKNLQKNANIKKCFGGCFFIFIFTFKMSCFLI